MVYVELELPEEAKNFTSDLHHNAIVVFSPIDKQAEVDIYLLAKEKGESLKTYGNSYKEDKDLKISAYYRNSSTTLGGSPAVKVIGTFFTSPNIYDQALGYQSSTYKILSIATLLKNKDFLEIRYWDKSNYNDYLPIVEKMINSFQIRDIGPIIQEEN